MRGSALATGPSAAIAARGGAAVGGAVVLVALFIGLPGATAASDGSLDPTFGSGGTVTIDVGGGARGVVVDADGKIVAGGRDAPGDFALVRLNPDGSPDATFGTGGMVTTGFWERSGGVNALALQPDGKIVAMGTFLGFALARYHPDGSLDATFGSGGLVSTDFGYVAGWPGPNTVAHAVALQPDGKIVAAGHTQEFWSPASAAPRNIVFALARYHPDGTLDTTFGGSGTVKTDFGVTHESARAVLVQPDGKIVAGGPEHRLEWGGSAPSAPGGFALARYHPDGSLDATFGTGGKVTTDVGAGPDSLRSLVLQDDGKIVAAGATEAGWGSQVLVRYHPDGSLDLSFGSGGMVTNPNVGGGGALALQADGKLVASGSAGGDFAVARYDAGGSLDESFGRDGIVTTDFGSPYESAVAVALQPDGDIVAAGSCCAPGTRFALARYQVNVAPIATDDGLFLVSSGGAVTGNVLGNDTDADGDVLTAAKVTDPTGGQVSLGPDGSFTYIADLDFHGEDAFSYRAHDGSSSSSVASVGFRVTPRDGDVGLHDPLTGEWHLRSSSGTVTASYYGDPGDVAVVGDWDCDGVATPGVFRRSDTTAYLRNSNTQGTAHLRFLLGNRDDIPLAGDFDGDGCDTLSLYRPSEQRFYIVNRLGRDHGALGPADFSFVFGNPGDEPVVGDWDGDGVDEVGLHRESTGLFYWRNTLDTGVASGAIFFGDPGDRFVAGDWGIVDGRDTPAVYRPSTATFYFRHTLTEGVADSQFTWTGAGSSWLPVAGAFPPG